jgi:steroid delta-isomerase-like uncharacterized protein
MATTTTSPPGVDLGWLATYAEEYLAAWNSHVPERLLALMAPDIVYDDTAWPTQMRGHEQVRAFLDSAWRALPDLRFELVEGPYVVPGKPKAAFHWRGRATTGRSAEFEGVDFHEYRAGQLARLRIDFDLMDVSRQFGLLPAQGSRAEAVMAGVQRLGARVRR